MLATAASGWPEPRDPVLQDDMINPTSVLQNNLDPSSELQNGVSGEMHVSASLTDIGNKPVGFYGPIAPPVPNASELRSLHATVPPVQSEYPTECHAAAAVPLPESP